MQPRVYSPAMPGLYQSSLIRSDEHNDAAETATTSSFALWARRRRR